MKVASAWWPTALTVALVLWLTLAPDPVPDIEVPSFFGKYADKIVHAIMMGGITGAVIFDYKRQGLKRNPDPRSRFRYHGDPLPLSAGIIAAVIISVTVFSFVDEYLQDTMHLGRSADIFDFAADMAGMAIALFTAPPVVNRILRSLTGSGARSR